ncbi:uncharacterized protein SCHCODRAFT_02664369 [Schizophyllum commune H4-8]|nr:uncharacterized protein SCHCODRAFT_02664369 [Schizophyllum commune H4-8]KAI5896576.1 hypothetical protein SCHCODRAFT_02664369 [Schizophyllum commune H4-8]
MILDHLRPSTNSFFALIFAAMYQSNQRSRLPLRAPASQHGANRFAPYRPPPHILFAPRLSTIPLPDVPSESSNAGPITSMLASSAQTAPSQVVPPTLAGPLLSTIASHLVHQPQPVQQGPSASPTASSARLSLTRAACHSSVVPHDLAPPPATSDAMPAQPVAGAARHSPATDADAPSLPYAADVQDTTDNAVAQSSSSAPRSTTASSSSSFKDGHVELSGTESFAGGICVLPERARWGSIKSLTVTSPITINDLHLILYQATKLEKAVFASVLPDTEKERCRFKIHAKNLQRLTLKDIRTPIGSFLDDLEATQLHRIRFAYNASTSQLALRDDEQNCFDLLVRVSNKTAAGTITVTSNNPWYAANRAPALREQLRAATGYTWAATVG